MSNPVRPSDSGLREWARCLDHPLRYCGAIGPGWHRRHAWACEGEHPADAEGITRTPVYFTTDGSGHIDSGAVTNTGLDEILLNVLTDMRSMVNLLDAVTTYVDHFVDVEDAAADGFGAIEWVAAARSALAKERAL